MTKTEFIIDQLEEMADGSVVSLWNNYCEANNDPDNTIFDMDYFDEMEEGRTPSQVVDDIDEDFDTNDDYIQWHIYGIKSSSDPVGDFVCLEELAEYIERGDPEEFWDEIDTDDIVDAAFDYVHETFDLEGVDEDEFRAWLADNVRDYDWDDLLDEFKESCE